MQKLKKCNTLALETNEPFNFKFSVWKPSHFPTRLESLAGDSLYRTIRLGSGDAVGLKLTALEKKPGIKVDVYSKKPLDNCQLADLEKRLRWSYGLDESVVEFYEKYGCDTVLKNSIEKLYGMRNSCAENLFEILCIALVLQNTNVKRSQTMLENLLKNFGEELHFDGQALYAFFTPASILKSDEAQLKAECRVGYRAKYLLSIAGAFNNGFNNVDFTKLNYDDAKNQLIEIKGVGDYSASIALSSYLKDYSHVIIDSWSQKIFSKVLNKNFKSRDNVVNALKKRWDKYAGLAVLYVIENLYFTGKVNQRGLVEQS
jgi:3-methyladenine DNA glycosylase/8-oxoguanine DNA glycosylase